MCTPVHRNVSKIYLYNIALYSGKKDTIDLIYLK